MITIGITLLLGEICFDVMYVAWKLSISQKTVVLQMTMMISICILHFLYDLFMLVV
jgi:hypothetical protein